MRANQRSLICSEEDGGVVLMMALLLCLGCAILVVGLSNALLVGERAARGEALGREGLRRENDALAELALNALLDWTPRDVTLSDGTVAHLSALPDGNPWRLRGTVSSAWRGPSDGTPGTASALIERGRDGPDLPVAGLVATSLSVGPGHSLESVLLASVPGDLPAALVDPPALSAVATPIRDLEEPWRLGEGWELALSGAPADTGLMIVEGAHVLTGRPGTSVELPDDLALGDSPAVVVLLGGADLDARDQGALDAVLVVDDGGVDLEGTQLRGAVICSGAVDLGATGSITFVRSHLRWATDQSLRRVRLLPGSRQETWGSP